MIDRGRVKSGLKIGVLPTESINPITDVPAKDRVGHPRLFEAKACEPA